MGAEPPSAAGGSELRGRRRSRRGGDRARRPCDRYVDTAESSGPRRQLVEHSRGRVESHQLALRHGARSRFRSYRGRSRRALGTRARRPLRSSPPPSLGLHGSVQSSDRRSDGALAARNHASRAAGGTSRSRACHRPPRDGDRASSITGRREPRAGDRLPLLRARLLSASRGARAPLRRPAPADHRITVDGDARLPRQIARGRWRLAPNRRRRRRRGRTAPRRPRPARTRRDVARRRGAVVRSPGVASRR